MTFLNSVLCDYIHELKQERLILRKQLEKDSGPVPHKIADICKALHDASNELGLSETYQITDPPEKAVAFIKKMFGMLSGSVGEPK